MTQRPFPSQEAVGGTPGTKASILPLLCWGPGLLQRESLLSRVPGGSSVGEVWDCPVGEVGAGCALHRTLRLCPDGSQLSRHDSVPGPPHWLCLCLGGPSALPPPGSSSLSSHPCCGDAAWGLTSWNQVRPPSDFCCMISGKRSDLSEPQFPPLHNGSSNSAYVTELLGRLHD